MTKIIISKLINRIIVYILNYLEYLEYQYIENNIKFPKNLLNLIY